MKSEIRMRMLESNLKNELCIALVRLELLRASITKVSISKDMRYASIYCIDSEGIDLKSDEDAAKRLEESSYRIAAIVKTRWLGYRFPKFRFVADKQIRREEKLYQKISEMMLEDKDDSGNTEDKE